ncbi:MAG: dNTP triphosphohydrolase [Thermomicrobiales bacterium]|nr:dNTP triphosphohydrolase [Thermomicrobiales bacterium]
MVDRRDRLHRVPESDAASDERTPFEKDRDRLIYSSNFQRLGRVTQVVAPNERFLTHNRLTHSLEVAQVARGLANSLLRTPGQQAAINAAGGIDASVVEAAALAHDLGHPPFGHVAEAELDRLLVAAGLPEGYEGNAQSFRIITKLGVRYSQIPGFNLTRATLNAVLKYPWQHGGNPDKPQKWGAYQTESAEFTWARELSPLPTQQVGLEAALMDWADDIAYAVHDMSDFYRAGLIPLDRLANDEGERDRFMAVEAQRLGVFPGDQEDVRTLFDEIAQWFPNDGPFVGTRRDRASLRSFTSSLISQYINAVSIQQQPDGGYGLTIDPGREREVQLLKGLTWYYVINSPALTSQRFGQRSLIRALFGTLREAAASPHDVHIFPPFYREMLETGDHEPLRVVADYIASMSEGQVVEIHQRLTGQSLGSGLERMQ